MHNAHHQHAWDYVLLGSVLILMVFGLIMITSIGVPRSIKLSAPDIAFPNCSDAAVDCYFILKKHVLRILIGLFLMWGATKIHYEFWRKASLVLFGGTLLLLLSVLIFGSTNNTFARSWFNVWEASIQPAEFARLALIFYLGHWMGRKSDELRSFHNGFLPFCVIMGVLVLPVLFQPDLGATLVLITIAVAIYFVAGVRIRDLFFGALVAAVISASLVLNVDYLNKRFKAFLLPSADCTESYCWQAEQAKIAVGSGGLWGAGLTQGIQKSYWLPQATDDFIFAASSEEMGFFRTVAVVILYLVIAYRGFHIALHAPTKFGMLTAVGITTWIASQAFLNIAVNISLFPITGITLPFVSYGGSSLTATLIGVGILLNISKHTLDHAYRTDRRRNRGAYLPKYRRFRNA